MKRFGLALAASLGLVAIFVFTVAESAHVPPQAEGESQSDQAIAASEDAPFPNVFLRDVVVSNTDPTLKDTDKFFNSEPAIAINPTDPRKIVVSSFSGVWAPQTDGQFQNSPLWYTTNAGRLWTKEFTISAPPGVGKPAVIQSPCDQTYDYGSDGTLYGTFLLDGEGAEGKNCSSDSDAFEPKANTLAVYSGATPDPTDAQAWRWFLVNGKAKRTNTTLPDQPWLIVSRNPTHPQQQNVYVGYQSVDMRVAVAQAQLPPDFTVDHTSGVRTPFPGNPGQRIAGNRRTGAIYSLHETGAELQCISGSPTSYMLNRSLDGGQTWGLNGSAEGISVAQVCSNQSLFSYAFGEPVPGTILGGVNALKGGIDALTVDSRSGDVYVTYGEFDATAGRDRIAIVRLINQGDGSIKPDPSHYVSGPDYQSALPAVAVAENGVVGVLYDTADGLDPASSLPYFSVHLAVSKDYGVSFQTVLLQKFLFPANAPSSNTGPRPLGDYQQLKSMGKTFYGVFPGDGQPFGRPFHKIDPIFVKASVK